MSRHRLPVEASKPTVRVHTGAEFMLRCAQLHLCDEDLKGYTMGMVYDMICEKANDHHEYPTKATQEDIYKLFGR